MPSSRIACSTPARDSASSAWRPGDRIAILSENRPEWAIADFASLLMRAADVPIYPTLPAKHIEYILRDSGAAAVCVSSAAQLAKIREIRPSLPALRSVITFDRDASGHGRAPVQRAAELRTEGAADATRPGRAEAQRGPAGRSRDADLHLRHDGRPEGRDADPRQHHLQRGGVAARVHASTGRTRRSRSCRCRTSSSGWRAITSCCTAAPPSPTRPASRPWPRRWPRCGRP